MLLSDDSVRVTVGLRKTAEVEYRSAVVEAVRLPHGWDRLDPADDPVSFALRASDWFVDALGANPCSGCGYETFNVMGWCDACHEMEPDAEDEVAS